jgi:hypothetical protein
MVSSNVPFCRPCLIIALCSDIGPLLLAYSGAGVSDFPKPPALCLKADLAEVVQFH